MLFCSKNDKKLHKWLFCSALFVLFVLINGAYWLYSGRNRPLVDRVVHLEGGNSGADYKTGVEVNLSSSLRQHPFVAAFRVKADFSAGSGGYNRTLIYDRRQNTIREHIFSYGAHENSRESEFLYQNVMDADLHNLAASGKFLEELPFQNSGQVKRQVFLDKK